MRDVVCYSMWYLCASPPDYRWCCELAG